jgi:hypothetical protein
LRARQAGRLISDLREENARCAEDYALAEQAAPPIFENMLRLVSV